MKKRILFLTIAMVSVVCFSANAQSCLRPVVDTISGAVMPHGTITPYPVTFTWNHTVSATKGTNMILIVQVACDTFPDSVLYGNTHLICLDSASNGAFKAEVWYLLNPDTGTNAVSIYFPAGSGTFNATKSAEAISFYNVDQGVPFGTSASATGTACPSSILVRSDTSTVVLDMIVKDYFRPVTPDPSQTKLYAISSSFGDAVGGSLKNGADSVTFQWSWTFCATYPWAAVAVPLMPVCINTGTNELKDENVLHLFPNPSAGTFTIHLNKDLRHASVKIMNMLGEEISFIRSEKDKGTSIVIELNAPAGIYFVQLVDGEKKYSKKVVIE